MQTSRYGYALVRTMRSENPPSGMDDYSYESGKNSLMTTRLTSMNGIEETPVITKVLYRNDYERIAQGRAYFGEFDPFGRLRPALWRCQAES
jgi:hypothetical protein